jgi:membrane-bound ClpP family serine protease
MRSEYDFSKGKRGAVISQRGKTRITIHIDNAVLEAFRALAETKGTGYQTMMNEALREYLDQSAQPLTKQELREVIREEMPQVLRELKIRPVARAKE